MTDHPQSLEPDKHDPLKVSTECRLNPLWIETPPASEAALEIAVSGLGLQSALETNFRKVERYPAESLASIGPSSRMDFPDGTFDLVTLFGRKPEVPVLQEVVRVLKPSGIFFLAVENRWWIRRLLGGGDSQRGSFTSGGPALARQVRSVGFSTVRQYFLLPSLERPEHVVPAHLPALCAHETLRRRDEDAGVRRRVFFRLRLFQFLYPGRLIIARL